MLIAVLVVMVCIGLLCAALVILTKNDLQTGAALSQSRAVAYAGDSALEVAIEQVRYRSDGYATRADCLSPGPLAINGVSVEVLCSALSGDTASVRHVQFEACHSSDAACAEPIAIAQVTFDDLASGTCTGAITTTCGTAYRIESWAEKDT